MKIDKIITHDGIFHADEIFAIALIQELLNNNIPVERTRNISQDDVDNPLVWIIDVNGSYDPSRGLFDHHQDGQLEASCILVLNHLRDTGGISKELHEEMVANMLVVSDIDRGQFTDGFQVNSLIRMFNCLPNGFETSLELCKNYVRAAKDTVGKLQESLAIWQDGKEIAPGIKYCDQFPIHWKRYSDSLYLIYPHNGKYNVITKDSDRHPLFNTTKEEFMHKARFLAVFQNKEDAIECAKFSMSNNSNLSV